MMLRKPIQMKEAASHRPTTHQLSTPVRLIYAALGLVSVGLGILGAILPGLPTTIFLIIASFLLTRSCPWLEEKIMGLAIFKPFLPFVRGERGMPRKAKITALAMMWTCVGISVVTLSQQDAVSVWVQIAIVAGAAIGTVFICRA